MKTETDVCSLLPNILTGFFSGKRAELIWFTVPRHTRSESGPIGNETSQNQWYHLRKFGGEIYYIFHEGMTPTLPVTIYRDNTNIIETLFSHDIRFFPFVWDCGLIKSPCTGLKHSSRFSAPVHTLEIRKQGMKVWFRTTAGLHANYFTWTHPLPLLLHARAGEVAGAQAITFQPLRGS